MGKLDDHRTCTLVSVIVFCLALFIIMVIGIATHRLGTYNTTNSTTGKNETVFVGLTRNNHHKGADMSRPRDALFAALAFLILNFVCVLLLFKKHNPRTRYHRLLKIVNIVLPFAIASSLLSTVLIFLDELHNIENAQDVEKCASFFFLVFATLMIFIPLTIILHKMSELEGTLAVLSRKPDADPENGVNAEGGEDGEPAAGAGGEPAGGAGEAGPAEGGNPEAAADSKDGAEKEDGAAKKEDGSPEESNKPKSPEKSPKSSPKTSPKSSPKTSPKTSPKESPKTSPKASPKTSPKTSPKASPKASPKGSPKAETKVEPEEPTEKSPLLAHAAENPEA